MKNLLNQIEDPSSPKEALQDDSAINLKSGTVCGHVDPVETCARTSHALRQAQSDGSTLTTKNWLKGIFFMNF